MFYSIVHQILTQSSSLYFLMSAQKEPTCLQELQKQVQDEAQRTGEKHRSQQKQEDELVTKSSPKKQDQEEIRLNVKPEQPILKSSNIFSQPTKQEAKINIFANSKSVNLFNLSQQGLAQKGLNIFTKAINEVPSVAAKEDEDLSDNSEGVNQADQQLKQPAERVMKYAYENRFEKLGEFKLVKFRAGEGALKEGMVVTLEKDPKQGHILYFFLKNQATKVVVYKAILLPGAKLESFSNRKENMKLTVLKIGQEQQSQRQLVKLQFQNEEASKRFSEIVSPAKNE